MTDVAKSKWVGGLAHWTVGETAYLSIAFTWKIFEARKLALYYRSRGFDVKAGGPGIFHSHLKKHIADVADVPDEGIGKYDGALTYHNPAATMASRGCGVGCWFCIVDKIEPKELLPDFSVRPILCDNNLSVLPVEYQKYIVSRYQKEGVPLLDANSGFEPLTFTDEVLAIWKPINRGPWRFAYDEIGERDQVLRVMKMLKGTPGKKRVYVLIGNEPFESCMGRIREVIENGCEPHVQPLINLNALVREPSVRHDWTLQKLRGVARWANGYVWRKVPFSGYKPNEHRQAAKERYDEQQGLFL